MGKASSAKKVARAARTGGKTKGQSRRIGFPVAVVALVLLGVSLVTFARSGSGGDESPKLGDHWHAAYGIYVCDRWVSNLSDRGADQLGIHTHDDGLMHIHPFLAGAAGRAATLGKFFDQTGMSVSGSSITLPEGGQYEGRKYVNGETTCGGKKGRVVLAYWENALKTEGKPTETSTSDISGEHIDTNFGAYTIAFVPEGEDIPPPPSAADIEQNATVDGGEGQPIEGAPEGTDLPDESTVPAGEETPSSEPPADGSGSTAPPASSEPAASTEPPPATEGAG
ncbi:MAG TPA: hypothetical protein VEW93_07275 [Acidimicrobiales bacterium]|nr:hypothetical protein [Acidimicrobiales bacterium]